MRVALAFLQHYREHGEYLERTYGFVERVGIEAVAAAVLDAESGEPARLLRALRDRQGRRATPTRGASATTPVHPKQFAELDTEAERASDRRRRSWP